MVTLVALVRHGETPWNAERRFQGWTDVELNDAGRDQARRLGDALSGRSFDAVWSSDLIRATETARIAGYEAVADLRLRELDFGSLEGAVWDQLGPETQAALVIFDDFAAPGGESIEQLRQRVTGFLDALGPGRHLLFTHGGVIRLVARECGFDGFPGHAEVVEVDWTNRTNTVL